MDKEKKDARISISHGGYAICSHRTNSTLLEVINSLCREASEQNKVITKAEITMKPKATIITDNKSL